MSATYQFAEIKPMFEGADHIWFLAKRHNPIDSRKVLIGADKREIRLIDFFSAIGVTAFNLEPVFLPERKPAGPNDYAALGSFPSCPERYAVLSKIIGKTIHMCMGVDGGYFYRYTVQPEDAPTTESA